MPLCHVSAASRRSTGSCVCAVAWYDRPANTTACSAHGGASVHLPLGSLGCLGIVELRALWRAAIACAIRHHCCAACLHRAWYARCMGGRQTAITAVSRSVLVIVRGVRSDAIPSRDAPLLGSDDCIVSARALVGLGPHSASSPRLTWQHQTGFLRPLRQHAIHLYDLTP